MSDFQRIPCLAKGPLFCRCAGDGVPIDAEGLSSFFRLIRRAGSPFVSAMWAKRLLRGPIRPGPCSASHATQSARPETRRPARRQPGTGTPLFRRPVGREPAGATGPGAGLPIHPGGGRCRLTDRTRRLGTAWVGSEQRPRGRDRCQACLLYARMPQSRGNRVRRARPCPGEGGAPCRGGPLSGGPSATPRRPDRVGLDPIRRTP
jgi:hypothetical protein